VVVSICIGGGGCGGDGVEEEEERRLLIVGSPTRLLDVQAAEITHIKRAGRIEGAIQHHRPAGFVRRSASSGESSCT
jgi:hypothetical protein